MMRHNFTHKHKHTQYKNNQKILLHINHNHRLAIKIEVTGGYLIETGDVFLAVDDGPIHRKIYTMEKILKVTKELLSHDKYLQVEKFFMERNT